MQHNNIVLITGGTGDIGTAIAKELNSSYKHIFSLDLVSEEDGKAWQKALIEQGYKNIYFRHMDVTDYEQCGEVISSIIEEFGNIDVLINNAGITRDAVFTKMTKKQWDEVLTVNLDGMFNTTRIGANC